LDGNIRVDLVPSKLYNYQSSVKAFNMDSNISQSSFHLAVASRLEQL